MEVNKDIVSTRLPEHTLKGRGTVIITRELQRQIDALHKAHPGNEWSGVLVIEPIAEDITEPDTVVLKALAIYPMDFGSPGYTEYTLAEEVLDIYELFPDADPAINDRPRLKFAQIHTHHNMRTFFSGVDEAELRDNVDKYDYYLSLIVNCAGEYSAKVAFLAQIPQTISIHDRKGGITKTIEQPPKKILAFFSLDIDYEEARDVNPDWFKERVAHFKTLPAKNYTINEHAPIVSTSRVYQPYGYSPVGKYNQASPSEDYDDDYWADYGKEYSQAQRELNFEPKKETEKVKDVEEDRPSQFGIDASRLRLAATFLFVEDQEKAKGMTFFMAIDENPLKAAESWRIQQYVGEVMSGINDWFGNWFPEECLQHKEPCEKAILLWVQDKLMVMNIDNPVAAALVNAFDAYIQVTYK